MPSATIKRDGKVFLAVLVLALAFSLFTQHVWEDYWITFRASRNLATGHGLVFTQGERLHTFTSPLGVLLPAGLSWLNRNKSDELVVWCFRITSIAAFAMGIVLLRQVLSKLQRHRVSTFLTLALVALDAKTVDFTINGMETGLLIFFLGLTLHGLLLAGPRQTLRIGAGWAGLMWTRPDSCVYIAVLGIGALIFLPGAPANPQRKIFWKQLLQAGLVCTVLYLPWFLWAWNYYGSPLPHTVVAKSTNAAPVSPAGIAWNFLLSPFTTLAGDSAIWWVFAPAYSWLGGWHRAFLTTGMMLGIVAAYAWFVPVLRAETRMLSLAFYLGLFFLGEVVKEIYPWYLPTVAVLGYLAFGLVFDELLCLAQRLPQLGWSRGWLRQLARVMRVAAVALIAGQTVVTIFVARQMAAQQTLIENGLRREIGLWLRDHAASQNDSVFLEPLGYIGYFSQLKMLDYPGLSSKEMVETRRRLGPDKQNQAYLELKADWLVLRPTEIQNSTIVDAKRLAEFYELARTFDVSDKVQPLGWLPGKSLIQSDQTFIVLHRKAAPPAKPSP